MKPTNDLFEQQVRRLYEGYEVHAPASTKDAVFNELDSANKAGSFASKSLLIAASVLTIGAIYMLSDQPVQTEVNPTPNIEEVVAAPVLEQEEPSVVVVEEEVKIEEEVKVITPAVVEEKTIAEEAAVVEEKTFVEESKVVEETPVIIEETQVVEEIKEVAQPVKVVETETPVVQEKEQKKEEVEWVLPAKIKVEK